MSRGDLALWATAFIWSLNLTAVKVSIESIHPLAFVALRFALGALVMAGVLVWRRTLPALDASAWRLLIPAAFLGIVVNQLTIVHALTQISVVHAALILGATPMFTALLAVGTRQAALQWQHWAGTFLGIVGLYLIIAGAPHPSAGNSGTTALGALLMLGAALSWAAYTVMLTPLTNRYPAAQLSALVTLLGSVPLIAFGLPFLANTTWSDVRPEAWVGVAYAAIFAVLITNLLYFGAVRSTGAPRAVLVMYIQPFIGALGGVVLLGEQWSLIQIVGGTLLVAGVATSRSGQPRAIRRPTDIGSRHSPL